MIEQLNCSIMDQIAESEVSPRVETSNYEFVFVNSLDGILITQQNGIILDANPMACQLLGRTKEELINAGRSLFVDITDPRWLILYQKKEQTGSIFGQLTFIKKDGTKFEVELSSSIFAVNSTKRLSCIIFRDITKRVEIKEELEKYHLYLEQLVDERILELKIEADKNKKISKYLINVNRELARNEIYMRTIFENTVIGISLLDLKTGDVICNNSFQEMIGYSAEEFQALDYLEHTHPDDVERELALLKEAIESKSDHYQMEKRCIRRDGKVLWAKINFTIIRDSEDNPQYYIVLTEDITQHKLAEETERTTKQEMSRLERLNLIGQMAAGVGHEIRNPLTVIRGFLQMLNSKSHHQDCQEYYELMISELDRANTIITNFLSLAKNTSPNSADLKSENLTCIIEQLLPLLQADAWNLNKYLEIDTLPTPDLLLNKQEIHQLILNLVQNGLQAMLEGGCIKIKTFVEEEKVVLVVKDEGSGIPTHILCKLGTPFLTTKEDGTGLGLATCFAIAQRHNAKIEIDSGSNGTTFYIKFNY